MIIGENDPIHSMIFSINFIKQDLITQQGYIANNAKETDD
jgi:hypothetical protein